MARRKAPRNFVAFVTEFDHDGNEYRFRIVEKNAWIYAIEVKTTGSTTYREFATAPNVAIAYGKIRSYMNQRNVGCKPFWAE